MYFSLSCCFSLAMEAKLPPPGRMCRKRPGRSRGVNNGGPGARRWCLVCGCAQEQAVQAQLCTGGDACGDGGLAPRSPPPVLRPLLALTGGVCGLSLPAGPRVPLRGQRQPGADKRSSALGCFPLALGWQGSPGTAMLSSSPAPGRRVAAALQEHRGPAGWGDPARRTCRRLPPPVPLCVGETLARETREGRLGTSGRSRGFAAPRRDHLDALVALARARRPRPAGSCCCGCRGSAGLGTEGTPLKVRWCSWLWGWAWGGVW